MKKIVVSILAAVLLLAVGGPCFAHSTDDFIKDSDDSVLFLGYVLEYDCFYEEAIIAHYYDGVRERICKGYIEIEVTEVVYGDLNNLTKVDNGTGDIVTVEEDGAGNTVIKRKDVNDFVKYTMQKGQKYIFVYDAQNGQLTGIDFWGEWGSGITVLDCEDTHFCFLQESLDNQVYVLAEKKRLERLNAALAETSATETSAEETSATETSPMETFLPETVLPETAAVSSGTTAPETTAGFESINYTTEAPTEEKSKPKIGYIAGGSAVVLIIAVIAVLLLKKK